jgi:ribosomal protein S12 methylthiotransferase accessory factor
LVEVIGESRPDAKHRMEELIDDPRRVAALEDHDLLYASSSKLRSFDFLRKQPLVEIHWKPEGPSSPSARLHRLIDHFRTANSDLLYFNLTPLDLHGFGVHTARVIVPGFQPIDFGWKERRLGGERLYELPQRLGLRNKRTTIEQLNTEPHQIS